MATYWGVTHQADAMVRWRIVEVAHDDEVRTAAHTIERVAEVAHVARSVHTGTFGGFLAAAS